MLFPLVNEAATDVTYNPRRRLLGAIPIDKEIAYHIFNIDTNVSKGGNTAKLYRKSKWNSQHSKNTNVRFRTTLEIKVFINYFLSFLICSLIHSLPTFSVGSIISIDFDPNGKSTATVDNKGRCLISDIDTGHYCFHLDNGNRGGKFIWSSKELFATSLLMTTFSILLKFEYLLDDYARCRWSSSSGNPLLYIKYDEKYLNALDVEKKTLTLKNPVELERFQDLCNLNIRLYYSPSLSLKGITNMRIGSMFAPSMEI